MNKKEKKNNIDFIGIGAMKAGTTWLYKNLNDLKEFDLPPVKEFHYFDKRRKNRNKFKEGKGLLFNKFLDNRLRNPNYIERASVILKQAAKQEDLKKLKFLRKWYFSDCTDKWYLSLFDDQEGFTGEITPAYSILKKQEIERMHKILPDVRLVYMVRNPIDRAWSHYRYRFASDRKKKTKNVDYNNCLLYTSPSPRD